MEEEEAMYAFQHARLSCLVYLFLSRLKGDLALTRPNREAHEAHAVLRESVTKKGQIRNQFHPEILIP